MSVCNSEFNRIMQLGYKELILEFMCVSIDLKKACEFFKGF